MKGPPTAEDPRNSRALSNAIEELQQNDKIFISRFLKIGMIFSQIKCYPKRGKIEQRQKVQQKLQKTREIEIWQKADMMMFVILQIRNPLVFPDNNG